MKKIIREKYDRQGFYFFNLEKCDTSADHHMALMVINRLTFIVRVCEIEYSLCQSISQSLCHSKMDLKDSGI